MRISDFDYDLPERLIAQAPLEDRAASRLLVLGRLSGEISERRFKDVASLFAPGDLLVLNDTRVSARRLTGQRPTGGQVEVLTLSEVSPDVFSCLVRPAKRLREGATIAFADGIEATVVSVQDEGLRHLRFSGSDWRAKLQAVSTPPLPPYIHETLQEPDRYQTTYARQQGSAAAPTAGLHFTQDILNEIKSVGVGVVFVTLHVGLDTFRPMQVDDVAEHRMHGEVCEVSDATADAINAATGRIIAVGTTTVRTLESFAVGHRLVEPGSKVSRLFITPGFHFQIVDGMFTNFHLPRTTMLLMISALAGAESVRRAYRYAISKEFRFLSFGDSMLIL